ncbi:GXGXG motif protein [Crateriforma conspicua]|uniref:GXGXG motif protein n=1 Tax=Crateriforma conspicua TaxID=2527996 RepID=A0A5C6FQ22_9PLAN|nr:tributyrin esterase [Crateriforma conspicua]TWU63362.1 GXGXG motif protein [Crateriforma conspicua]
MRFDLSEHDHESLRNAIAAIPIPDDGEDLPVVQVDGAKGQHAAMMRLDHPVRIEAEGDLGDFAFAHHAQATVRLTGSVGNGVGEGMRSGTIGIRGNAGVGPGAAMRGGTLAIYGSVGDRCGAAMRGGEIFIRGDAGDHIGIGALGGTIVIGGNAGRWIGNAQSDVSIFIRGSAESLAEGVTEAPLRKREQLRLGLLLINASIRGDASEFRRIVPDAKLHAEQAQQGELVPNWR